MLLHITSHYADILLYQQRKGTKTMNKLQEKATLLYIRTALALRTVPDRLNRAMPHSERGAEGVEMGLIIAGVAAVIMIVLAIFKDALIKLWQDAVDSFG
jgi:Flp pilus assembly pilin Flp